MLTLLLTAALIALLLVLAGAACCRSSQSRPSVDCATPGTVNTNYKAIRFVK
jgi:hypothetical protein